VWLTAEPAGRTFHRIAETAVAEGWDQSTIVVQDDVRWKTPPDLHQAAEIVLYGGYRIDTGHVCPRAFSANTRTWALLQEAWAGEPERLCPGFMAVMREVTVAFLDQIEHTEPAGKRPWPRTVV